MALISPKGNMFGRSKIMSEFLTNSDYMSSFKLLWTGPNLGLLTVAALFPEDWECDYIDENYKSINYDKDYDFVFIGAMTQQANNAFLIASAFRNKGTLTVIGGIHATLMAEEASHYADVVISGEVEPLWDDFMRDLEKGCLKQIYREEQPGQYKYDNSPIPRYELLKGYDYPLVTLQTTRGCPHDCSFCAASKVYGKKYRRKGNKQILQELIILSQLYPDALILFSDDNMFVDRNSSKSLLQDMAPMKIRWIAQTDISIAADEELLKRMVVAGCQWIVIGFESTSYESLCNLDQTNWKLKQLPRYENSIQTIQSYGIGVYGTFIVGLDYDDEDVFKATADFIIANNLYGANITVPTPLPGTRLRQHMQEEQRIVKKDWSFYTFWDVTIQPKRMSSATLEAGLFWIYSEITQQHVVEQRLTQMRKIMKRRRQILNEISGSAADE
ncbi:radical SAM protein [Paenibacillus sp. M1]|uniref:Radical SAM protein n=1 Tax=Paenibacillus haidiansis TaxID=1574488 RepID=A0ABU7VR07_9BACL